MNGASLYDVLLGLVSLEDIIVPGPIDNLFLAPSVKKLAGAEIELVNTTDRDFVLKKALDTVRNKYRFIILDCPPSLGLLTINALGGADSVLIPVQCEYYAMEGLSSLLETIELVKTCLNPSLELEGVLLTMHDIRTNLSSQVATEIRNFFSDKIFHTLIPRNVRLGEAPSHGLPIILYDNGCKGSASYIALTKEIIARET